MTLMVRVAVALSPWLFDAVKESWKTELMEAVDVVMPQSVTWGG